MPKPTDAAEGAHWNRVGQFLLWGGVVAFGARRGGLLGVLALGYGLERLSALALGQSLGTQLRAALAARAEPRHRFGEGTRDAVDEASWESFPASDPPGRGVG